MSKTDAKYQQIVDWVKNNIENGTFRYGDKLMSEAELGTMFGLSRQTVRRATGELAAQKLVTRVHGSGTYIGGVYQPVRQQKYMSIAVVSTFYESYIFPMILKGIAEPLSAAGYSMQVSFTDNSILRERELLNAILEKDNIDGLVIEPSKSALPNPNLSLYEKIREKNIPIISFNASYPGLDVPCIRLDDCLVARKAARLLLQKGHRKIAAMFKSDDGQGPLRYQGFVEELISWGVEMPQERILWMDTPQTIELSLIADHVFKRIGDATAVLCYNDQVAYQLIELARERGIRVPEDLSVVGIDNSNLASVGRRPFTSFNHPKEKLGVKVGENILKLIQNPEFKADCLFEGEEVDRGSVKDIAPKV